MKHSMQLAMASFARDAIQHVLPAHPFEGFAAAGSLLQRGRLVAAATSPTRPLGAGCPVEGSSKGARQPGAISLLGALGQ